MKITNISIQMNIRTHDHHSNTIIRPFVLEKIYKRLSEKFRDSIHKINICLIQNFG